jgi:Cthe_2314-like HEPN
MSEFKLNEREYPKAPIRRTTFLKRRIVGSDGHSFVGRVFDLGVVSLNFDSYEELSKLPDVKYAIDVGRYVSNLTERVESLNLVGDLLWPEPFPADFSSLPVHQYQWLAISTDVFLVRYTSVVDCALLLSNEVLQLGLSAKKCTLNTMARKGMPKDLRNQFEELIDEQHSIRMERNARVHHGRERAFTWDDQSFRMASLFGHRGSGLKGHDAYGREIDLDLSFKEGLVGLQFEFNRQTRKLEKRLDVFYSLLWPEFEDRFRPLIAAATHGLNANARQRGILKGGRA